RFLPIYGKPPEQNGYGKLTEREMDFLKLMSRGLSNKEIADELFLSIRTVQGHLRHIFEKLGVSNRMEAVLYALKDGLVTLDEVPRKSV
ncbi:response regulator transcription factor, partial [Chloroflexota bacterium]